MVRFQLFVQQLQLAYVLVNTHLDDAQSAGSKPVHPQLMMYKCVAKPWVMRLGALLLGAASFMVVWSEATIGLGRKPDVSPFSLVMTGCAKLLGDIEQNDTKELDWSSVCAEQPVLSKRYLAAGSRR